MEVISNSKTEVNTVEAEFKVNAEEFEVAVQAAYLKKRKNIQIPGFRKGKAPRKMIETQFGESVFFEDAVNGMYQKVVSEAIDELKIDVIDIPDIEVVSVSKSEGVTFKAVFTTKPEVEISDYLGLKVKAPSNTVSEDDITEKLTEMQLKSARIVEVSDRATKEGDTVVFNFAGYCDGELFEGGSADDYSLELGSGRFIPGFEEQLVGKSIGDDFDVNVTFPADYNAAELAGKDAVFKCKINQIKEKELAELDDEFVKDVSEFDTLAELKADLKVKLKEEKEIARKNAIDNDIADQLIGKLQAEIPAVMFEKQIDNSVQEWEYNNSRNGIKVEDYLKYANITMEQFREFFREPSESRVKLQLALEKIAELEKIEISDEEIDEELQKLADTHQLTLEKVKQIISVDNYRHDMKNDRALNIVKDNAKITTARATKKKKDEEEA